MLQAVQGCKDYLQVSEALHSCIIRTDLAPQAGCDVVPTALFGYDTPCPLLF
jgi:hypothetical protein